MLSVFFFCFWGKEVESSKKGGSCYRQLRRRQTRSLEAGRLSFTVDEPQAITELLCFSSVLVRMCGFLRSSSSVLLAGFGGSKTEDPRFTEQRTGSQLQSWG
jgi:hypothetical protein